MGRRYTYFLCCAIYRYRKDFGILRREGFYAPPASHGTTENRIGISRQEAMGGRCLEMDGDDG